MLQGLITAIRRRSREQWQDYARTHWGDLRDWMQRNGELSAGIGLLTGVAVVLEFEFFLCALLLAAAAAFGIWQIAQPESERDSLTGPTSPPGSDGD